MVSFQRILLATDFSEASARAAEHAVMLARKFGAGLHVLHVLETDIPVMSDSLVYLPPTYFEELENRAAEQLEQVIARQDRDKLGVTLVMRKGSPFVEIVRYAREQHMDLIVQGTHGRGAVAHVLLGNVAEKVIRKAPCPVLTVRHLGHEFSMP